MLANESIKKDERSAAKTLKYIRFLFYFIEYIFTFYEHESSLQVKKRKKPESKQWDAKQGMVAQLQEVNYIIKYCIEAATPLQSRVLIGFCSLGIFHKRWRHCRLPIFFFTGAGAECAKSGGGEMVLRSEACAS